MKLRFLSLIALIIAVSSLHLNVESQIDFNREGTDVVSSSPLVDLEPMRSPNNKSSRETEIFTQSFTGQAIFADLLKLPLMSCLYYIPVYSLTRLKEFFLLI